MIELIRSMKPTENMQFGWEKPKNKTQLFEVMKEKSLDYLVFVREVEVKS